jgi:dihydrofolate reductase
MITLIAAMGCNNEIGCDNKLLWNIPEDMKHFKEYTMGKVVVMGRKTFDSIGRTLPGRKNVIVTSQRIPNMLCVDSIEKIISIEHCYPEIVVIGGEAIYRQTMPFAHKLVITYINQQFRADAFFPVFKLTEWHESSKIDCDNEKYKYSFVEYERIIK